MHGKTSLRISYRIYFHTNETSSLKSVEGRILNITDVYYIKLNNTNSQYLNEKSQDSIRKDAECKFRHEEYALRYHILTNLERLSSPTFRAICR